MIWREWQERRGEYIHIASARRGTLFHKENTWNVRIFLQTSLLAEARQNPSGAVVVGDAIRYQWT